MSNFEIVSGPSPHLQFANRVTSVAFASNRRLAGRSCNDDGVEDGRLHHIRRSDRLLRRLFLTGHNNLCFVLEIRINERVVMKNYIVRAEPYACILRFKRGTRETLVVTQLHELRDCKRVLRDRRCEWQRPGSAVGASRFQRETIRASHWSIPECVYGHVQRNHALPDAQLYERMRPQRCSARLLPERDERLLDR